MPDTTVIAADVCGKQIGNAIPGVNYVIHNFDGADPLCRTVEPDRLLRLQVWTSDAYGLPLHTFRQYDPDSRILFQPWGTDLLPEEFYEPVYNPSATTVPFIGAVWSDLTSKPGTELGNKTMISELERLLLLRHLSLRLYTHISDTENVQLVRAGRIAPAFAGRWQTEHSYLPCRAFKNVSYGQLGITNVFLLAHRLSFPVGSLEEQLDWALSLKRNDYLELVREQQRFVSNYTYRDSIQAIGRAFE
jgi:hypothetical protein